MIDRIGFLEDLKELKENGDPILIEYYLNQRFIEIKDDKDDSGRDYFTKEFEGTANTPEFVAILQKKREFEKNDDILFVLNELADFYAQTKPELVDAVRTVMKEFEPKGFDPKDLV